MLLPLLLQFVTSMALLSVARAEQYQNLVCVSFFFFFFLTEFVSLLVSYVYFVGYSTHVFLTL
jgi:hypothetical protein